MDSELALAIALSLQEEKERQQEVPPHFVKTLSPQRPSPQDLHWFTFIYLFIYYLT
jgi:hypothetical protein